jgi:hypothetical protein
MDVAGLHDRSLRTFLLLMVYLFGSMHYLRRKNPSVPDQYRTYTVDSNPGPSVRQAGVLTTLLLVSLN